MGKVHQDMKKEVESKIYTDTTEGIIMLSLVLEKQFRRLAQEGNLNSYIDKFDPYRKEQADPKPA